MPAKKNCIPHYNTLTYIVCLVIVCLVFFPEKTLAQKKNLRELGVPSGITQPGTFNGITDVKGVLVGHTTLIKGDSIRTGVTAILPFKGNIFQQKVPAAIFIANGFGKLTGYTQVQELGNLETPIILTNTSGNRACLLENI